MELLPTAPLDSILGLNNYETEPLNKVINQARMAHKKYLKDLKARKKIPEYNPNQLEMPSKGQLLSPNAPEPDLFGSLLPTSIRTTDANISVFNDINKFNEEKL
jgi:hypothetical protein